MDPICIPRFQAIGSLNSDKSGTLGKFTIDAARIACCNSKRRTSFTADPIYGESLGFTNSRFSENSV